MTPHFPICRLSSASSNWVVVNMNVVSRHPQSQDNSLNIMEQQQQQKTFENYPKFAGFVMPLTEWKRQEGKSILSVKWWP